MATTASTIKKTTWNSYDHTGYTYDCANDQRSAGGIHIHQVRLGKHGWQHRICQSNGSHTAYSPVTPIDDEQGETWFEQAKAY
jgi:hypothetical protein